MPSENQLLITWLFAKKSGLSTKNLLIEFKVNIYFFFFVNRLLFKIESIHAFYFVNDVAVYKALLVKVKGGKLFYKLFIVNVISMHLSATWKF